jgi:hypothetical protein
MPRFLSAHLVTSTVSSLPSAESRLKNKAFSLPRSSRYLLSHGLCFCPLFLRLFRSGSTCFCGDSDAIIARLPAILRQGMKVR